MRSRFSALMLWPAVIALLVTSASADPPRNGERRQDPDEVTVFVTGSLIPQRVKLHPTGTKTVFPLRVIDRTEIDKNGRTTTPGALINDPAVQGVPVIHH